MQCPHPKVRSELPPLTARIASLPVDSRGYPVPYFVAYLDGKPDFRLADPDKLIACVRLRVCWTCGQPLGRYVTFAVGPMCCINRTSSEPPSHLECVLWSVKGCPFLSRPNMVRREDELTDELKPNTAGFMIERNPGVTAAWTTRSYKVFPDPQRRPLFEMGPMDSLTWWSQGRPATRQEVQASLESGFPALLQLCENDRDRSELYSRRDHVMLYLPEL